MKQQLIKFCLLNLLIMLMFSSCKSYNQNQEDFNPVTDLPKEIRERYGTDIVINEMTALKLADVIFKSRFPNIEFEELNASHLNLIADGKVWEIKVVKKTFKETTYCIRINKNTGEVLNLFAIK